MTELQELFDICKCSVHITKDQHKAYYQTVAEYLADALVEQDLTEQEYDAIVTAGTVYEVQAYSHTPIEFYISYAATLESAVSQALAAIKESAQ